MDPLQIPTRPSDESQAKPQEPAADVPQAADDQQVPSETPPASNPAPAEPGVTASESVPEPPIPASVIRPDSAPPVLVTGASMPADQTPPADNSASLLSSAPAMPVVVAPRPRKKLLLLGLIIAAALLLLGGSAAAAYFGYYVPNKPDNLVAKALASTLDTAKAKTMQFSGAINVTEKSSNQTFGLTYQGQGDNQSGAFELSAKADVMLATITFDARSVDGQSYFLKVGGLDGVSQLLGATGNEMATQYAPYISMLNDQWFELNASVLKQFGGDMFKGNKLPEADRAKLIAAYKAHPFLTVKQKLADESIKGAASRHYKVVIDNTKLKAFMTAVQEANISSLKLTKDQLKELNKNIDAAKFGNYPMDVWIAKETNLISQIGMKFSDKEATMDFRLTVDSYNKPVKVEKPSGAKSLLELLSTFYSSFTSNPELTMPGLDSGISL